MRKPAIIKIAARRLSGKRAQFLMVHAVLYACLGFSYVTIEPTERSTRAMAFSWLPGYLPISVVGWIWIIAAAVALFTAIESHPPRSDRVGFMALTAVPIVWSLMFLISWVSALFADHDSTAWVSAAIYAGYATIVILVSSWPNPINIDRLPPIGAQ
jgi:hypothetical protein